MLRLQLADSCSLLAVQWIEQITTRCHATLPAKWAGCKKQTREVGQWCTGMLQRASTTLETPVTVSTTSESCGSVVSTVMKG